MNDVTTACYLCGNPNLEVLNGFSWLVHCQNCGLIYNPALTLDPRDVASRFYDEANVVHRKKIQSVLQKAAKTRWKWLAGSLPRKQGRMLEIGCGTGEFLVAARNAGWRIDALELSEIFRRAAKSWYGLDVRGEELSQANFSPGTFDLIVLLHVFEHLTNPRDFLGQLSAIVKPGGFLFIIVPNVSSWTDNLFATYSPTLSKKDHFFHYDTQSLRAMISQSNFEVTNIFTKEPAHHLWTSLYSFLSIKANTDIKNPSGDGVDGTSSVLSRIKSNLPYLAGGLTSPLLFPLRLWMNRANRGHEIYLLCQKNHEDLAGS